VVEDLEVVEAFDGRGAGAAAPHGVLSIIEVGHLESPERVADTGQVQP
jgi:hypothetical protein